LDIAVSKDNLVRVEGSKKQLPKTIPSNNLGSGLIFSLSALPKTDKISSLLKSFIETILLPAKLAIKYTLKIKNRYLIVTAVLIINWKKENSVSTCKQVFFGNNIFLFLYFIIYFYHYNMNRKMLKVDTCIKFWYQHLQFHSVFYRQIQSLYKLQKNLPRQTLTTTKTFYFFISITITIFS